MNLLPVALLAVPLAGAAVLLFTRAAPRWYGAAVSGVTLALAVAMAAGFDAGRAGDVQFAIDRPWIPGLALRFHLGVDGVSLPLVVMTALLSFLCFLYLTRHRPAGGRHRALVFTLLVLEVGMIGTFLALDLLLFFVFFEIVLVPMYFVIAVWGGAGRGAAAVKFILYTLLGSAVLLLGLLLIWAHTGTLDMVRLAGAHGAGLPRGVQVLAFLAVALGFAVKAPMWPLHTWLPAAHTEAPTVGSVLLAGVLLKMGTYGLARIAIPVLPEGAAAVAPFLGAFAVAGIVYGSLACLAQRDLKRMIAYSSVGHMGFVLLGLATLTPVGMNAALFGNIAHGVITGLLFFLAGAVKERYGTTEMSRLGSGMLGRLPYLASLLTFAAVASLGVPGLAGFWGEMLALLGAFQPAPGQSRPLFLTFMAAGGLGGVLTAAYFLLMLSRLTHGTPREPLPALAYPSGGPAPGEPLIATAETPEEPRVRTPPDASPARAEPVRPVERAEGMEPVEPVATDTAVAEEREARLAAGEGAVPPGPAARPGRPGDVTPYELASWIPLVVLTLVLGLWPKLLLTLTDPAVQAYLGAR